MNYRMTSYLLGMILTIEAALLLLPTAIASLFGEDVTPFLYTILIVLAAAIPLTLLRPKNTRINAREGFVVVALAWILMSLFGALPYVFSGTIPNYVDAMFETISGFTTTGSTILTAIEGKPMSILFWRSFTHWVGGMGVLMLMLAILPMDPRSIHLMRAEVPGPTKGKLVPQLKSTAKILYAIYIALTLAEFIALLCTGLGWFDSLINAFATAGTGGFGIRGDSIASYSAYSQWVITAFMLLFGVNFNLYFLLIARKFRYIFKSTELKVYLFITVFMTALITINTSNLFANLHDGIRTSAFQVASILTTTGFATADFDAWSPFAKTLIFLLMFVGGCAGSTAGGMKLSRLIIIVKRVKNELRRVLHPRTYTLVKLDGKRVDDTTLHSVSTYMFLYMFIIAGTLFLLSFNGLDFETNISAAVSCFNNVGPGFSKIGPTLNYTVYSPFSKIVLSVAMLLGRLEIYPILLTFSFATWTNKE